MLWRMSRVLTTAAVDPRQRLAYWTDMVCDTYVQLECDVRGNGDSIDGEIAANALATLQLSRVTSTAQLMRRTPAKIARASEDYFLVNIQARGRGVVSQDGRDAFAETRGLRVVRQHATLHAELRRTLPAIRSDVAGPDFARCVA